VRIRIGRSAGRSRPAVFSYHRLARRELRLGWLGDDAIGIARVLNDAVSIYFAAATCASAFVARWRAGSKIENAGVCSRCARPKPAPRIGAGLHRTP